MSGANFRVERLKLAVLASVIAKSVGFILQVVSIPLAVSALGPARFGIYTMIVSAVVWLEVGRFGIGPGLTSQLASAAHNNEPEKERKVFTNAFSVMLMLSIFMIGLLAAGTYFFSSSIPNWSFLKEIDAGDVYFATFLLIICIIFQMIFGIADFARSAYQEDYINNIFSAATSISSIVLIYSFSRLIPTISGLCFATFGAIAIFKLLNWMHLVFKSRPFIRPHLKLFEFELSRTLVVSGSAFGLCQIATLLLHNVSLLQLGAVAGPASLASFVAVFRLFQLLSTGVLMLTTPTWSAVIDARMRGDFGWIKRSYVIIAALVIIFSVCCAVGMLIYGAAIIGLWIGSVMEIDKSVLALLSLYFVIWMWNHLNTIYLYGLDEVWYVAKVLLFESVAVIVSGFWLIPSYGSLGLAVGLVIAGFCISAWLLPKRVIEKMVVR